MAEKTEKKPQMSMDARYAKKFGSKFNKTFTPKSDLKFASITTAKNLPVESVRYDIRLLPINPKTLPDGFVKRWVHDDVVPSEWAEETLADGRVVKKVIKRKKLSCPGIIGQNCPFDAYVGTFTEEDIDEWDAATKEELNRFIAKSHLIAVVLFRKPVLNRDGSLDEGSVNSPRVVFLDQSSLQTQLRLLFDELKEKHDFADDKEVYGFLSNPTNGRDLTIYANKKEFNRISVGEPSPLHSDPNVVKSILDGTICPDMTRFWKIETDFKKLQTYFEDFYRLQFPNEKEIPVLEYTV